MLGTIEVRVSAGHPNMPLKPIAVFQGSAATIGVLDVPRTRCGATVTGVAVAIENADGTVAAVSATQIKGVWCATFGANHFATCGQVANGITVTVSGIDEHGESATWTVGKGDIEILSADGLPTPGEKKQFIRFCDFVPDEPRDGDIASVNGVWSIYTDGTWNKIGNVMDLSDIDEIPENCNMSEIKTTVNKIIRKFGAATVIAVMALSTFGDIVTTKPMKTIREEDPVVTSVDIGAITNLTASASNFAEALEGKQDKLDVYDFVSEFDKYHMYTYDISTMFSFDAEYAMSDWDGNVISDTYATKTELTDAVQSVDVTSQIAPLSNNVARLSQDVAMWTGYWGGDDVRVTITNYFGNLSLPAIFFEQKMPPDEEHQGTWFKTIWDERTRWEDFYSNRFAAVEFDIKSNLAQRAWGMYDSATGALVGDPNTLQISHKQILLLPDGLNWETVTDTRGNTAWIMVCTAPTYISNPANLPEGKISVFTLGDGTAAMEVVQSNKRIIGAHAGNCRVDDNNFIVNYPVTSAEPPRLIVGNTLTNMMTFVDYFGYPATTENVWSGQSGAWVASIPTTGLPSFFVTAKYEVGGNSYIRNNVAHSSDKIVVGGIEYDVHVETINGKKMLTLTEAY